MDGLEQTHEPDVAIVVEDWAQTRLAALRATAEDLVGQFWAQAALERGRRPRKEWGRLGVRVRLQRAPRSQPGAFSIEWFVCRWANRQGGATVKTAYIRRGAELRYSRAAFRGLAQLDPQRGQAVDEASDEHEVILHRLGQVDLPRLCDPPEGRP